MPKSKLESKIEAKARSKAKGKKPSPEEQALESTKGYTLLSQFLKDKRSVLPTELLAKFSFAQKLHLIEELSQYIITTPENNIIHIQTLMHLGEDDNLMIAKMALISAAQVFKDVAPMYEIDEDKLKESLKKQITKEERRLLMFELHFLEFYKRYVAILTDLLKIKPKKYIQVLGIKDISQDQQDKYEEACKEYNRVALLCLSDLVSSLFHLTFQDELANLVALKLKSFDEETRRIASKTVCYFFADQNPASFKVKYAFVHTMSKIFGSTPEVKLPDNFMDPLNTLTLQSNLVVQDNEEDEKQIGKNNKPKNEKNNINGKRKRKNPDAAKLQEKLKQEKRLKKELKVELKEAQATIDPKRVEYFKNEILKKIFYMYFKILKLQKPSKFFNVAINGILKFVHLISAVIISDLIDNLGACGDLLREYHLKHFENNKLLLRSRITCIFASIEIIKELGKAIELDDRESILTLYHLFFDLCKHPKLTKELTPQDHALLVKTLHKIFIAKRQLSLETTASFIKIFIDFAIKTGEENKVFTKTLLYIIKLMMQKYTPLTRLMEEENEGFGLDMYNPNVEDPQATNALRTYIGQDLKIIQKKYSKDTEVQILVKKIEAMERLPTHLASLTPFEFFKKYSE